MARNTHIVKLLLAGCALFIGLLVGKPALAAGYDMSLTVEGVTGEGNGGDIVLNSFSWGEAHAGKAFPTEVGISKALDSTSGKLLQLVAAQQAVGSVTLHVRSQVGPHAEFLTIKFSGVRIASVHESGQVKSTDTRPNEQVMMRYEKIEFSYQPLGNDGKPNGSPVTWSFDFSKQAKDK